jgi:hypothetical protein
MQVVAGVSGSGLVMLPNCLFLDIMGCHCHCYSFCLFLMPSILFGRPAATEFPYGFTFVTFALHGCFAGILLGLKEFHVLLLVLFS